MEQFKFNSRLISENLEAFENISFFQNFIDSKVFSIIVLDLSDVVWLEGELCSILNAIIYKGRLKGNVFKYIPPQNAKVNEILQKNGFLSTQRPDINNTVVRCRMYDSKEIDSFMAYISKALIDDANKFPFSRQIKEEFRTHLGELFDNAFRHSDSEKIFTCGQYFPQKHVLAFCLTDVGIGIPARVASYNSKIKAEEAMRWVFQGRNTTKLEVGGLGLKLFKQFISDIGGSIVVLSENLIYKVREDIIYNTRYPFKGTSFIFKFTIN